MTREADDIRALASECREWIKALQREQRRPVVTTISAEFQRLATKLDAIAERLTPRMATSDSDFDAD